MTITAKRALVIAAIALTGCSTDRILKVERPDIIDPTGLNNPAGVTALYAGVIGDLAAYMDAAVGVNASVGLFTDELRFGATPPEIKQFDTRSLIEQNTLLWAIYRNIQQLRGQADRAAEALKTVSASDTRIGEMNAISGFSYVLLGELFCSGVPIGNIGEEAEPITTTAVLQGGIAKLDAAIAAAGSDARIKNLAAVLKARALLDLGQFDAAATAVASVPTDFKYTTFHSATTPYQQNLFWNYMFNSDGLLVSEKEGTNGLNYATANDPRVPISGTGAPSRFDATTPRYYFGLLTGFESPTVIASGAEARLIEAEAELRKANNTAFLAEDQRSPCVPKIERGDGSRLAGDASRSALPRAGIHDVRHVAQAWRYATPGAPVCTSTRIGLPDGQLPQGWSQVRNGRELHRSGARAKQSEVHGLYQSRRLTPA